MRMAQSGEISVPHSMCLEWFGQHRGQQKWPNGVDDGQCIQNEKEWREQENAGQNATIYFHKVLYVAWPGIAYREILWENCEQMHVIIGW